MPGKRLLYFILILITIPLGLASRAYASSLPYLVATYGGDVLAAVCIFFGVRFLAMRAPLLKVLWISYLVCIIIEALQLYQAPWIVKFRNTPPFGILFGHWFLWSDWICYAVGVLIAFGISLAVEKR